MATIGKSEAEWRAELSEQEYHVLRGHGTEPAWSGALLDNKEAGTYRCRACGAALFRSDAKFNSGSGWPSFYECIDNDAVVLDSDDSFGMSRTEVRCATCDSHLGHVFPDGHGTPTGDRYCINSVCLTFEEAKDEASDQGGGG
ncbi:MAG: peptide-methionine (R)-S-oxide reductase MsrB [Demequinaceae bacterium]|nr:peptide-methionine (R)-S-oxide reductase MsrB [Demequinaceae bacterium]